jgi:glycosyltransferase involved in cell wall biosynthesis
VSPLNRQGPGDRVPANVGELAGKRVLLLFPHMVFSGGALSYTLHLAEQLLGCGATVAILVLRVEKNACRLPAGLEVINVNGPLTSSLGYWLLFPFWGARIKRAVSSWRPDVLVPQVFPSNWWGWLVKKKHPQMKLVWICHEPSAFIHSINWIRSLQPRWKSMLARVLRPVLKRADLSLVRYSDRILANSQFTAGEMERVYGRAPDGIASPGIDVLAFCAGKEQKGPAIMTVGRLTRFKRVDFLLKVFKDLLKAYPDLTYHIVGIGEEELALREQARSLRIESRVVFHGSITDVTLRKIYQRSLLFLHGSIGEPFGMAPLEAIASGTPVVAHRSGGPAEFVTAECGRLVDSLELADWVREVANYLQVLSSDPESSEKVRACASRFDWSFTLQPAIKIIAGQCTEGGQTTGHTAGHPTGPIPPQVD